jgi:hypothetical protein
VLVLVVLAVARVRARLGVVPETFAVLQALSASPARRQTAKEEWLIENLGNISSSVFSASTERAVSRPGRRACCLDFY